jgi:hypothetical protein
VTDSAAAESWRIPLPPSCGIDPDEDPSVGVPEYWEENSWCIAEGSTDNGSAFQDTPSDIYTRRF